ncbi:hypothetical protein ACFPM3_03770 [Streptomyces coeruleoprunus]|uniref:Uncharacterized protein n=1 Tax=Streptomyces coeruleoprunus TaxID=285563 RepID=A0ABV9X9Y3_9ACTN
MWVLLGWWRVGVITYAFILVTGTGGRIVAGEGPAPDLGKGQQPDGGRLL